MAALRQLGVQELGADGRADIPARSFDLLGECFLEVGVRIGRGASLSLSGRHRRLRASDVVASCAFSVDGRTVEEFTGEALDVALADWPRVLGTAQLLIGPLPFFFCSGGPQQFANVFASGAAIHVELTAEFKRERERQSDSDSDSSSDGSERERDRERNFARIVYKVVHLDCGERRAAAESEGALRVRCLSQVHTSCAAAGRDRTLFVALPFDGLMKDLRVAVTQGDCRGCTDAVASPDGIRRVELLRTCRSAGWSRRGRSHLRNRRNPGHRRNRPGRACCTSRSATTPPATSRRHKRDREARADPIRRTGDGAPPGTWGSSKSAINTPSTDRRPTSR